MAAPESGECPTIRVDNSVERDAIVDSASAENNDFARQLGSHEDHWLHFDSSLLVWQCRLEPEFGLESASEGVGKILAVLRRLVCFEANLLEETAAAVEEQLSWGLEE